MGNFANTLFSVLLGWAKNAVSWLWQLIGADGADGMLGWVLDNWLALAVALCIIGLLIDLVVYLIRWQPYRVWSSFLHRNDPEEAPVSPDSGVEELRWIFANGETVSEAVLPPPVEPLPVEEPAPVPARPAQRVIPARRRRAVDGSVEYVMPPAGDARRAYHEPYYPPQWRAEPYDSNDGGAKE